MQLHELQSHCQSGQSHDGHRSEPSQAKPCRAWSSRVRPPPPPTLVVLSSCRLSVGNVKTLFITSRNEPAGAAAVMVEICCKAVAAPGSPRKPVSFRVKLIAFVLGGRNHLRCSMHGRSIVRWIASGSIEDPVMSAIRAQPRRGTESRRLLLEMPVGKHAPRLRLEMIGDPDLCRESLDTLILGLDDPPTDAAVSLPRFPGVFRCRGHHAASVSAVGLLS